MMAMKYQDRSCAVSSTAGFERAVERYPDGSKKSSGYVCTEQGMVAVCEFSPSQEGGLQHFTLLRFIAIGRVYIRTFKTDKRLKSRTVVRLAKGFAADAGLWLSAGAELEAKVRDHLQALNLAWHAPEKETDDIGEDGLVWDAGKYEPLPPGYFELNPNSTPAAPGRAKTGEPSC